MNLLIREVRESDLDAIINNESSVFSPEEAATREAMKERIQMISDSFIIAETDSKELVGYVVGPVINERYLYDELFESISKNPKSGGYQSILSLSVNPRFQGLGIAKQLLLKLTKISKEHNRKGITLTCLENLIHFYEQNGYTNEGLSESKHGGKTWYNMIKEL